MPIPLPELLRWVAQRPAVLSALPQGMGNGRVRVRAVIADLWESLFESAAPEAFLRSFQLRNLDPAERNRAQWVLAAAYVLWHPLFREPPPDPGKLTAFLAGEVSLLAAHVAADQLERDEERREELIRRALRAADRTLPGESVQQGEDRLRQLDSVERERILKLASDREQRNREVQRAMAKKAREEAAAKVSRE